VKRLIVLALLPVGALLAQESITITSEPILLRPKRDSRALTIVISAPVPGTSGTVVVSSSPLKIKGVLKTDQRVRSMEVNGVPATIEAAGGFSGSVPLRPGMNELSVRGEDAAGNLGTARLPVIYDTGPPVLEILEPEGIEMRGIRALSSDTSMLRGRAYDESGIQSLTANGVRLPVDADSGFSCRISQLGASDSVVVIATDASRFSSRKTLYLSRKKKIAGLDFLTGRSYAFVIGIDAYSGMWPRLKNAVRDAKAVEAVLAADFQFDTIYSLYDRDATREKILGTLEYLVTHLKPDDNLLIYYSGHGVKEKPFNRGFWVPVDATQRSVTRYISNSDIQLMLDAQSPRHVLLVADACFAGDIFKGNTEMVPFDNNPDYYGKIATRKSRKALTSGGEEPVMDGGKDDHSVFAYYFLRALKNIRGAYFDAGQVFNELRIPVTNNSDQVPEFAPIKNTGDEGGQFIFVRK
jgi:hypothetical protein